MRIILYYDCLEFQNILSMQMLAQHSRILAARRSINLFRGKNKTFYNWDVALTSVCVHMFMLMCQCVCQVGMFYCLSFLNMFLFYLQKQQGNCILFSVLQMINASSNYSSSVWLHLKFSSFFMQVLFCSDLFDYKDSLPVSHTKHPRKYKLMVVV